MTKGAHPFDPRSIDGLPTEIAVFPLSGALLLPRATLPLNIFEPRYLAMVTDSFAKGRMFGMVQPSESESQGGRTPPQMYRTGCLGRISAFQETEDGRILLVLRGLCRFEVTRELEAATPYRQVEVSYARFAGDLQPDRDVELPRDMLMPLLRSYFERNDMEVEWSCIEKAPPERLINYLSMLCPFDSCEKQALLEAPTVSERARRLIRFVELSSPDSGFGGSRMQ